MVRLGTKNVEVWMNGKRREDVFVPNKPKPVEWLGFDKGQMFETNISASNEFSYEIEFQLDEKLSGDYYSSQVFYRRDEDRQRFGILVDQPVGQTTTYGLWYYAGSSNGSVTVRSW